MFFLGERFVMTRHLHPYLKMELRQTVRFISAKRFNWTNIHQKIISVYEKHLTSRPSILRLCRLCDYGRNDITDYFPWRLAISINAETFCRYQKILRSNRHIKIEEFIVGRAFHMELCILLFTNTWNIEINGRDGCHDFSRPHTKNNIGGIVSVFCNKYASEIKKFLCRIMTGNEL